MKRTDTLIKELYNIERELRNRNPKEVCKALAKVEKITGPSICLNCFYQGCRDDLIAVDGEDLIDLYEEEENEK